MPITPLQASCIQRFQHTAQRVRTSSTAPADRNWERQRHPKGQHPPLHACMSDLTYTATPHALPSCPTLPMPSPYRALASSLASSLPGPSVCFPPPRTYPRGINANDPPWCTGSVVSLLGPDPVPACTWGSTVRRTSPRVRCTHVFFSRFTKFVLTPFHRTSLLRILAAFASHATPPFSYAAQC